MELLSRSYKRALTNRLILGGGDMVLTSSLCLDYFCCLFLGRGVSDMPKYWEWDILKWGGYFLCVFQTSFCIKSLPPHLDFFFSHSLTKQAKCTEMKRFKKRLLVQFYIFRIFPQHSLNLNKLLCFVERRNYIVFPDIRYILK